MSPVLPALLAACGAFVVVLAATRAFLPASVPAAPPSAFTPTATPSPVTTVIGSLSRPSDPTGMAALRQELDQAGLRAPRAAELYLATRTGLAILLPLAVVAVGVRLTTMGWFFVLASAAAGYYLPRFLVRSVRGARQDRIRAIFPDALDMLVSCVESGLGIDAALRHVARELTPVSPVLAGELDHLSAELQAGLTRAEALARFDARIGVEEVTALVNVVGQAERYGAGIAESIRAHAKMSRRQRLLDAERRAAEAAPKLTVVMVLLVLPPLFVVLVGPTVIQVITEVIPMLEGR